MEYVVLVTIAILVQYFALGLMAALARGKAGLEAPATTGDEVYERRFRVHQNTMEQLVSFLPAMWMFSYYVDSCYGALLGVAFFIGRIIYSRAYVADPGSRTIGFGIGFFAFAIALVGTVISVVMALV